MIVLTGNTYDKKEFLKSIGGKFVTDLPSGGHLSKGWEISPEMAIRHFYTNAQRGDMTLLIIENGQARAALKKPLRALAGVTKEEAEAMSKEQNGE